MLPNFKTILVDLNTPTGSAYSGSAEGVEIQTVSGVIAIHPQNEMYLHLGHPTHITLRVGTEFLTFLLTNAAASHRDGHLTVVAEKIQRVPTE